MLHDKRKVTRRENVTPQSTSKPTVQFPNIKDTKITCHPSVLISKLPACQNQRAKVY